MKDDKTVVSNGRKIASVPFQITGTFFILVDPEATDSVKLVDAENLAFDSSILYDVDYYGYRVEVEAADEAQIVAELPNGAKLYDPFNLEA